MCLPACKKRRNLGKDMSHAARTRTSKTHSNIQWEPLLRYTNPFPLILKPPLILKLPAPGFRGFGPHIQFKRGNIRGGLDLYVF